MKTALLAAIVLCLAPMLAAAGLSLQEAQAAIEANLRTPEGKAYDQKLGSEFGEKYAGTVRQCKKAAGNDLASFWMLVQLAGDGKVNGVLLYPETKVGACARATLLKDRFSAPPRPAYWVGIYLKLAH